MRIVTSRKSPLPCYDGVCSHSELVLSTQTHPLRAWDASWLGSLSVLSAVVNRPCRSTHETFDT